MEVFVRNVPDQTTEKQLREYLTTVLEPLGVYTFHCHKFKGKAFATLTMFDVSLAKTFLNRHGQPDGSRLRPQRQLNLQGRNLYCSPSKHPADPLMLASLLHEEEDRKLRENAPPQSGKQKHLVDLRRTFRIESLQNGQWDYQRENLTFVSYYSDSRQGEIIFGQKSLAIILNATSSIDEAIRIDIPYSIVVHLLTGTRNDKSTVSLTLDRAPNMFKLSELRDAFAMLSLTPKRNNKRSDIEQARICSLDEKHNNVVSSCFVWRMVLSSSAELSDVVKTIKSTSGTPLLMPANTRAISGEFELEMESLDAKLKASPMPFPVKFQVKRLAQNGYLKPAIAEKMSEQIVLLLEDFAIWTVVHAIQKLARNIPFAGPEVRAHKFHPETLEGLLRQYATSHVLIGSVYDTSQRHEHLALVQKVFITPAGTYLEGPELETKNRILRKYQEHTDNFVRVSFGDEDFEQYWMDFNISNNEVFEGRFKQLLKSGLNICDQNFAFLGFSHSSLRDAQCWMMAPITRPGSVLKAQNVLADLGNFSAIRSPAKCAARIGQAFSDATDTITIDSEAVQRIPDIERNDRVFTDGCATISEHLLKEVWKKFNRSKRQRATLLQIRFQGAKGMLALDSTLTEPALCLRPSMIKFEGSTANDLEICGASHRPLPMHLNLDFIKILEDLGVSTQSFLDLQRKALNDLENISRSPINAARFLEVNQIGLNAQIPTLVRLLGEIGLNFSEDEFCRNVVDLARLTRLRDMKYRGRIPVENAHTLYGIADETGMLREGEVYCVVRNQKGQKEVLLGEAVITRAPAMHPGDIQIVNAVDVPADSPLQNLHNCIIFSQHGPRDLPSQLSGGDLDGDLFNIIWDQNLWPTQIYSPADYPRATPLDIGRPVEPDDMIDFFIEFMKNNQLGRICTVHRQIADQKDEGTLHPLCIKLAGMASVAVDYAKTGIPVEEPMPNSQQYSRHLKPDFMAHAPRLIIDAAPRFEDTISNQDDEPEALRALTPQRSSLRYYKSQKALGYLYRAIDETKFLPASKDLKSETGLKAESGKELLAKAWDFVQRHTIFVPWEHHRGAARQIRSVFEDNLLETIHQFSPHPHRPITELEVFSGTILGKGGILPNKRIRESSMDMKSKFDREVMFTIRWITRGDASEAAENPYDSDDDESDQGGGGVSIEEDEALARSVACFDIAMEEEGQYDHGLGTSLKSFAYVAAAICLRELKRFQGGHLRERS